MRFDSAALLRMILYAQTEAALLGHVLAAERLETVAQLIASELMESKRTTLSDDIFQIVEAMASAQRKERKRI